MMADPVVMTAVAVLVVVFSVLTHVQLKRRARESGVSRHVLSVDPQRRLSDPAWSVLLAATRAAATWRHEVVGTLHLLLGLAESTHVEASGVFGRLGIDPEVVRWRVKEEFVLGTAVRDSKDLPFSGGAHEAVGFALREALERGSSPVPAGYILFGLMREGGSAAAVLRELDVTPAAARVAAPHHR
jgi:ATP-dependent Clp protease ATP-binding subunit ClpA